MQPHPTQANLRIFPIPLPFYFFQLILFFNQYDCKGVMHRNPWSGLGSQNHTIPSTFFQPSHLRHRQSKDAHKLVGTFYQSQLLFITTSSIFAKLLVTNFFAPFSAARESNFSSCFLYPWQSKLVHRTCAPMILAQNAWVSQSKTLVGTW
jgi:hypothetical protein